MEAFITEIQALAPWQLTLLAVLAASLLVQLCFYLFFFVRLSVYKVETEALGTEPVSVIICAWNEEDNLRAHLESVLHQDHPQFEVIVVNDHSTDETDILLHEWQKAFPHLRHIDLNRENANMRGKKFAVSMGIKGAKYDRVVFTDADCRPSSNQWLRRMSGAMADGKEVVLGFGGFEQQPGLLNMLFRYEAVHIAMQYMSYALAGMLYMGVGRNLAYRKELFYKTKGFIRHRHIKSGDDDLLVNEVATAHNTTVVLHPQAHTFSTPKTTWADWWHQKRRHLTTPGLYRWDSKLMLGLYSLSSIGFWISLVICASIPACTPLAALALVLRWAVHLAVMAGVTRILGERGLLLPSLLGDVFSPFFNALAGISVTIKKPTAWK